MPAFHTRSYFVAASLAIACTLNETGTAGDGGVDVVSENVVDAVDDTLIDVSDAPNDMPEEPSGFDPSQIATLALWMRADKNVHMATSNTINGWDDSSGSSDVSKNAVSTLANPMFNASDANYNGHPTIAFSASMSQCLVTGKWTTPLSQPTTVFIVGNDDGDTITDRFFCDGTNARNTIYTVASDFAILAGTGLDSNTKSTGTPVALIATFNGSTSSVYVSASTPKATGPAGGQGIDTFWIGCEQTTKNPLNGKIAEIAVYASTLSNSEITQLLAYAGSRYALTIGP